MDFCLHCQLMCRCDPDGVTSNITQKYGFSLFWQGYSQKNAFFKGRKKKSICSIAFFKSLFRSLPSWRSPETRIFICLQIIITCLLTVRVCSKLNQAENQLFLQLKSERILYILLAFFNTTIIPLALVGYEMIIADSALHALFTI